MKAETSVVASLATAALVYGIYQNATPSVTDIRVGKPGDKDIAASRKMAAWTCAAIVGGVSLIAKDGTIFVVGGSMIVALDWWTRHANEVNPTSGKATSMATIPVQTESSDASAYGYDDAVSVTEY